MDKKLLIISVCLFALTGCATPSVLKSFLDLGVAVPQDYEEAAVRHFAEQGDAGAQFKLGTMYDQGTTVPQDYKEAVKWYRMAAEQGVADAQLNLGVMYYLGTGVTQDYVISYMWGSLAAASGEKAVKLVDLAAKKITPQQISDAQEMARNCLANNYKGCD